MFVGVVMRRRRRLLVLWSAQNSARIWKSLYDFFETRWPPLPLSATIAPSSALQLASPTGVQCSMPFVRSMSVVQPDWPDICAQPKTTSPAKSSPSKRFIAISPSWVETSNSAADSLFRLDAGVAHDFAPGFDFLPYCTAEFQRFIRSCRESTRLPRTRRRRTSGDNRLRQ